MTLLQDRVWMDLVGGIFGLLVLASIAGWILSRRVVSAGAKATIANVNARIRAWWVMASIFLAAISMGLTGAVVLFSLVSLLALREFITLAPTRLADHRA